MPTATTRGAELVGVYDIVADRAAAFAAEYGTTAYGTLSELVEQAPDLVSVATPPGSHTEVTVELLEAGCSVLLEKPPTTNLADLDRARRRRVGERRVRSTSSSSTGTDRAPAVPTELLTSGALGVPQSPSARRCGTGRTATSCPTGAATGPARAVDPPSATASTRSTCCCT